MTAPAPAPLVRAYEAKIDDVAPGERSVVAKINTATLDRYDSVIDPAGSTLDAYRKNPVVLWMHGEDPRRGGMPIGKNLWIKLDKATRSLVAKSKFLDDDFSDGIFRLYQEGVLRAFSVRALPDWSQAGPPTAAELKKSPEWTGAKQIYRAWDLLEYSAVDVPGNPEALALAVSRGLWMPEGLRARAPKPTPESTQEPELPPLTGARRFEDVHAAITRQVRELDFDARRDVAAILDLQLRGRV